MTHSSSRRGYTFVEAVVVTAIFLAGVTAFGRAFSTSDGLARQSRVSLRATEELRRNLDAVANRLRGASAASLSGFGAGSTSTSPSFRCATGADSSGNETLDASSTMQWQATSESVAGVTYPGKLVVVQNGVTSTIAKRVPSGGFLATLQGNTLKIRLSTYYTTSQGKTETDSGEISISLRN